MLFRNAFFAFLILMSSFLFSWEGENLLQDLKIVEEVDKKQKEELPFLYDFNLQGGYFNMPSARTKEAGQMGLGFSYIPPYHLYAASFSFFDRVEFVGNYWIFKGVEERNFGRDGFGDDAERSANIKVALLKRGDGFPDFPEFAFGFNDFIGTKRFYSFYVVGTQSILPWNLECSVGWAKGRMQGWFAGVAWSPFRNSYKLLQNLTFSAEYDVNDYRHHTHEHHMGREVKSRVNAGVHYSLLDTLYASVSSLRGKEIAASVSLHYNFGTTEGLFPKFSDPLPYTEPLDVESIGKRRTEEKLTAQWVDAFSEQGFDLECIKWVPGKKEGIWIRVINNRYREEQEIRFRIENILASLTPSNVSWVTFVLKTEGIEVQQYTYREQELSRFREDAIGKYELSLVSPMKEVTSSPSSYDSSLLYKRKGWVWSFLARPMFRSYFGSATGKFKYDVGLMAGPEGYLWNQIYYNLQASYIVSSSSQKVGSVDRLNPSQIIHVRSDTILYHQANTFHVDKMYLQKSWNMGLGWFSRIALGYFETAYAGIATELLYYPARANWAIGFEVATLLKRRYEGLKFQKKIRKMVGFEPVYVPYKGLQYFLDFYYDYSPLSVDCKLSLGQFLAKDKGFKLELGRYFSSGLRIAAWYTVTSKVDILNGSRYFDKGVSFSMPLDIFMAKSSQARVGYAMAAWLRDVGAKAQTGRELYPVIQGQRHNPRPSYY